MESAVLLYCLQPGRWTLTVSVDVVDVLGLLLGHDRLSPFLQEWRKNYHTFF